MAPKYERPHWTDEDATGKRRISKLAGDSQVPGAFRRLDHDHPFRELDGGTLMRDVFDCNLRWALLGTLANRAHLKRHMTAPEPSQQAD